jgi:hypothetical protein
MVPEPTTGAKGKVSECGEYCIISTIFAIVSDGLIIPSASSLMLTVFQVATSFNLNVFYYITYTGAL